MKIRFSKYQGAGNDFIMLDNRQGDFDDLSIEQIQLLCDRKFGIGADGLIKINLHPEFDFEADYYNADGSKSFCGNGGRCAVAFCQDLGMDVEKTAFLGFDGSHNAITNKEVIELQMMDVQSIKSCGNDFDIYTGSPHYIHFHPQIDTLNMVDFGRSIRYNETYKRDGINVNAVEKVSENQLYVRTYERGVEDETLACGTGVTAAAIAYAHGLRKDGAFFINVKVKGGQLAVKFQVENGMFSNVWLIGPGTFVFSGEINI